MSRTFFIDCHKGFRILETKPEKNVPLIELFNCYGYFSAKGVSLEGP